MYWRVSECLRMFTKNTGSWMPFTEILDQSDNQTFCQWMQHLHGPCPPGPTSKQASAFFQQSCLHYWVHLSLVFNASVCSFFSDLPCKMRQWYKCCGLLGIRDDVCEISGIVPNPGHLSSGCYYKEPYSGWLINNRNLFLGSGGWCPQFKVPAWQGSWESPLSGCRTPTSPIFM